MKKICILGLALSMAFASAQAQQTEQSPWTFDTRAWSTNYFTTVLFNLASEGVTRFAFKGNQTDSLWAERILPSADLVFPIALSKQGFSGDNNIYGPYHRAFSNPFKHIGDYGIGLDASYKPSFVGYYVGAYFKSQEVVFKKTDDNIRGFYITPRAGFIIGRNQHQLEAGVFYDAVVGCGGTVADTSKKRLKGGVGLDFALSVTSKNKRSKSILQFSMPLHNFFDTDYAGQADYNRKISYIMLTQRIML